MGPRGFSRQPVQLRALMSMGCLPAGGVGGPAGDRRGSGTSPGNQRPACTPFLAEHLLFESANPSFSSPAPNLAFGRASIFMNKVKIAQKADSPFPAPRPFSSLAQRVPVAPGQCALCTGLAAHAPPPPPPPPPRPWPPLAASARSGAAREPTPEGGIKCGPCPASCHLGHCSQE